MNWVPIYYWIFATHGWFRHELPLTSVPGEGSSFLPGLTGGRQTQAVRLVSWHELCRVRMLVVLGVAKSQPRYGDLNRIFKVCETFKECFFIITPRCKSMTEQGYEPDLLLPNPRVMDYAKETVVQFSTIHSAINIWRWQERLGMECYSGVYCFLDLQPAATHCYRIVYSILTAMHNQYHVAIEQAESSLGCLVAFHCIL